LDALTPESNIAHLSKSNVCIGTAEIEHHHHSTASPQEYAVKRKEKPLEGRRNKT
jgi:hypothetical protein